MNPLFLPQPHNKQGDKYHYLDLHPLQSRSDLAWMISQSRQYIFLLIETIDKRSKFFCIVIYASNSGMEMRKLWKDLEIQKIITNGIPWVILGDFNVTLKVSEHSNGSANPSSEMSEFQECVNNIKVDDLHSEGFHYTWTKSVKNPKCKTLKKQDKIMVNEAFMDKFQQAHGVFLPYMIFDHSHIIVRIPNGVQKRKGSFRFSNFITNKEEFLLTVRSVWNKEFEGHTMYRIVQKMKALKRKLKQLSWKNGNVFEKAKDLRKEVKEVQKEVDLFPHDESIKEKSCQILRKYHKAIHDEYSLLCQKAKVEWLKEGDRNTAYFHKTIKERVHMGRIMTIRNEEGVRFKNDEVAVQIVKHFAEFLGKSRPVQKLSSRSDIFINKLNTEEAFKMVRPISDSEIKHAMFDIRDSKAPGKLLGEVNATLISLVPKIPTPDKISDFKPIACCNVIYKCISKVMTNRIKGVLGFLVNENQSAFIGGRQITDNILLSQELFRGYNRKLNIKKVAFKIDLQKAYDTISWEFIEEVLEMFGFHKNMVIKKSLDEFSGLSGLLPNMQKSIVFFGGLSNAEQQNILNNIPFPVGKLPVRYLGVPLITKQISISNCKPLINKVKAKVIYEINKLLKGFLWCQGDLTKGKAKISWDAICKPKDQGGIGIKNLNVWNELKGRSIWEVQCDSKSSVGWKNILSLRDKTRSHIGWKIRDGKSVNVWRDKWCPVSPLSEFIDKRDIYDARLNQNCTMSEIIHEGRWVWPIEWNSDFEELKHIQIPVLRDEVEDKAVWISNTGIEQSFKVSNFWKDMNCNTGKVDWYPLVWFTQASPRHAFVTWLTIQQRLMTQDKLLIWRPNEDLKCALCNKCADSHNHLFFTCEFSNEVWNDLLKLLNVRLSRQWDHIVSEMKTLPSNKSIWSIVRRLVCSVAVYYIWQERNNRLFKKEKRDKKTIFNIVIKTIRMKLMGIKVKDSRTVKEVEEKWNIKMQRG
ncbi:RNA-directed DNA polymerase, eukaryota, reverse transcriptase zinc-binding domain protein [Tanacetum coccineum]